MILTTHRERAAREHGSIGDGRTPAAAPNPSPNPEQVKFLSIASIGTEKGGGFLGFGGSKKIDESKRQQLAQAAYQKGTAAINKFIEIGNDGMGLQVAAT